MKRKKKILISIVSALVCVVMLACVVLATTTDVFEKGANYDPIHEENGCCTVGSDSEPHYVKGYKDGLLDQQDKLDEKDNTINEQQATIDSLKEELNKDDSSGEENPENPENPETPEDPEEPENPDDNYWKQKYQETLALYNEECQRYDNMLTIAAEYLACLQEANRRLEALGGETVTDPVFDGEFDYDVTSETIVNDSFKQSAINEYIASEEYQATQAQTIVVAVQEFKGSDEYKTDLNNQYQLGYDVAYDSAYNSAYNDAYDAIYNLGVADGYAEYMGTKQYKATLNAQKQGAYEIGYTEGYTAGESNSTDFDMTTFISLIAAIAFLSVGALLITTKLKKRNRR